MRLALLSDIHGHAVALDAVLADLRRQSVDATVCLGDVATIGPQPKEVIERLRQLGGVCLSGNHEAALLDLPHALAYQIAPPLHPALQWCAQQLSPEDVAFLRSFQPTVNFTLGGDATLLGFHGSPTSKIGLLLPTTPPDEVDALLAGHTATVMAGGHSHIQMLRQHTGKLIINPGSVGSAFLRPPAPGVTPTLLPWAEYAVVSCSNSVVSVDLRRVPFELGAFAEVVARSDIPIKEWWQQQYSFLG